MLLAIDAGNTNVVFALVDDGDIRARWRIATDPRRTADEYVVWLNQLLELEELDREAVTAVIIGTVVPRALHNLSVLATKYFRVEPLVAGQGKAEWPIALDIVIDFGTATTFDVVDYNGAYKGGIIAPGINLSLDALVSAAAKLPRIAIEAREDCRRSVGASVVDGDDLVASTRIFGQQRLEDACEPRRAVSDRHDDADAVSVRGRRDKPHQVARRWRRR